MTDPATTDAGDAERLALLERLAAVAWHHTFGHDGHDHAALREAVVDLRRYDARQRRRKAKPR